MNKKTIVIVSVLLGILLIGIVSASLLTYFGRITGTAEVTGPVFYAASSHRLLINEFEGSTVYYIINDSEDEIFWTEELQEVLDFYRPKLKMYVEANLTEGDEPKRLELIFEYVDNNNDVFTICSGFVNVSSESEYQSLPVECEANDELYDVEKFVYRILGRGDIGTKYKIRVGGITRVEMDKA